MKATTTDKRPRVRFALIVKVIIVVAVGFLGSAIALRQFPLSIGTVAFRIKFGSSSVRVRAAKDLAESSGGNYWDADRGLVLVVLREGLLGEAPYRRAMAMSMLAELDPRHWTGSFRKPPSTWPLPEAALPVLIRGLGDRTTDVRKAAARVLGGYGALAAPALPALTLALDDWAPEFVEEVIQALLTIGPEAKAAVPALRELRGHRSESVVEAAAKALKTLTDGEG